jgi:hypothetical protein
MRKCVQGGLNEIAKEHIAFGSLLLLSQAPRWKKSIAIPRLKL